MPDSPPVVALIAANATRLLDAFCSNPTQHRTCQALGFHFLALGSGAFF
jgi:hypothetical protein